MKPLGDVIGSAILKHANKDAPGTLAEVIEAEIRRYFRVEPREEWSNALITAPVVWEPPVTTQSSS